MKLAVIGSRHWPVEHLDFVEATVLGRLVQLEANFRDVTIVSGGADGIDTHAEVIADKWGLKKEIYLPESKYPYPTNLFIRNEHIVKAADFILAFMKNGGSPGTMHAFRIAKVVKKPIALYYPPST